MIRLFFVIMGLLLVSCSSSIKLHTQNRFAETKIIISPFEEQGTLAYWKLKQKCKNKLLRQIQFKPEGTKKIVFSDRWIFLNELNLQDIHSDTSGITILSGKFTAFGPYNSKYRDHFTIHATFILYNTDGKVLKKKSFRLDFQYEEYEKLDPWLDKLVEKLWESFLK